MHTIKQIQQNARESAIANGASSEEDIHAYAYGYLSASLAHALNEINRLEAVQNINIGAQLPEWMRLQAD